MTDVILVFNGTAEAPRYRWFARGSGAPAEGSAAEAAATCGGAGAATVLLTSAHVLLTDVQVKVRNRRLLDGAVAYALEERLADDVEALLFEVGPLIDGTYPVAVTARALIAAVHEDLIAAGFAAVQCVPYVFAVPLAAAGDCVLHDGRLAVVRSGPYCGFTAPEGAGEPTLTRLAGERPARDSFVHYAHAAAKTIAVPDAAPAHLIAAANFNDWLKRSIMAGPLLQFAPGAKAERPRSERKLVIAAVLLLVALIVHTGFVYSKTAANERQVAQTEQDTRALFTRTFPQVNRIVNPRVQADSLLEEFVGGQVQGLGFLAGLHALGEAIAGLGDGTVLKSIRYQHGRFDLALDAGGVATLERVRTILGEHNLRVEIESADNRAERVLGRLRIEQAAP